MRTSSTIGECDSQTMSDWTRLKRPVADGVRDLSPESPSVTYRIETD